MVVAYWLGYYNIYKSDIVFSFYLYFLSSLFISLLSFAIHIIFANLIFVRHLLSSNIFLLYLPFIIITHLLKLFDVIYLYQQSSDLPLSGIYFPNHLKSIFPYNHWKILFTSKSILWWVCSSGKPKSSINYSRPTPSKKSSSIIQTSNNLIIKPFIKCSNTRSSHFWQENQTHLDI